MDNRVDTEELLIQLKERGIDTTISLQETNYVVQLTNVQDDNIIGLAKGSTLEGAFAILIYRLANDSRVLKETSNITPFDGLSRL